MCIMGLLLWQSVLFLMYVFFWQSAILLWFISATVVVSPVGNHWQLNVSEELGGGFLSVPHGSLHCHYCQPSECCSYILDIKSSESIYGFDGLQSGITRFFPWLLPPGAVLEKPLVVPIQSAHQLSSSSPLSNLPKNTPWLIDEVTLWIRNIFYNLLRLLGRLSALNNQTHDLKGHKS